MFFLEFQSYKLLKMDIRVEYYHICSGGNWTLCVCVGRVRFYEKGILRGKVWSHLVYMLFLALHSCYVSSLDRALTKALELPCQRLWGRGQDQWLLHREGTEQCESCLAGLSGQSKSVEDAKKVWVKGCRLVINLAARPQQRSCSRRASGLLAHLRAGSLCSRQMLSNYDDRF